VTGNEPDTSAVSSDPDRAEEELWLTYLNYDQSIQQAVRRLGALSQQNVDVFRSLLLAGRDRKRVKDYEAESIRRLQGEGFVGEEALQRALIVLTAEDPRYGEELKRQVAATGRPAELDQAVAAIRASTLTSDKQASVEQVFDQPEPDEPASDLAETPAKDEDRESVVVPLRKEWVAPAAQAALREEIPAPKRNLTLPLVIGAVILVAVAGVYFLAPIVGNKPERMAATPPVVEPEAAATPPAASPQAAEPSAPSAPAVQNPPAEAADTPDQTNKNENSQADNSQEDKSASSSPPLRPATTQPDTASGPSGPANDTGVAPSQQDVSPTPLAGANYKVVRGDMLSHIARTVYGSAAKFRLIQAANPRLQHKPDLILVDQVIFIPPDKP
jgi:nucleoid-associated protein YgaU